MEREPNWGMNTLRVDELRYLLEKYLTKTKGPKMITNLLSLCPYKNYQQLKKSVAPKTSLRNFPQP
jgi:hypothetical protein